MDIELLKTFIEVTQVRHFGRAAENLFLTPAAVSARIRQLEQMLGVRLLHRTRGNIQMTQEGQRLLPHARKMLAAWSDTLDDLSLKIDQESPLRLGSIASIWLCPPPNLCQVLAQPKGPYGRLHMESHSHSELISQVLAQHLDAAFLLDLPQHAELNAIKIGDLELTLYTSKPRLPTEKSLPDDWLPPYIYIEWSAAFAAFHNRRVITNEPFLSTSDAFIAPVLMQQIPSSAYLPKSPDPSCVAVDNAPGFLQAVYLVYKAGQEHSETIQALLMQLKPQKNPGQ